jgi:ABC-2 type transport system permease protein
MNAAPLTVVAKLVALVPVNALWAMPAIGWLMLCSAFAKRMPFLWAVLIPIGTGTMLSIFDAISQLHMPDSWFWHHVVFRILCSVMPGSWIDFDGLGDRMEHSRSPDELVNALSLGNVGHLLAQPSLWIGVAAGAAMIAGAIWLRRWRDDT